MIEDCDDAVATVPLVYYWNYAIIVICPVNIMNHVQVLVLRL